MPREMQGDPGHNTGAGGRGSDALPLGHADQAPGAGCRGFPSGSLADARLVHGDRWVSPPRYHFAQKGTRYVVQSKMQRIDSSGERKDLYGEWRSGSPGMIDVIPADNGEVTLVVNHPGAGTVTASAGGEARLLRVKARQVWTGMHVEILQ